MKRTSRIRTALAATAAAGIGLTLAASPAHASNPTLTIKNASGTVIAKAWYTDTTDNLCVKSYVAGQMASVQIGPSGGAPFAQANDAGFNKPNNCTGNLSIPEDKLFWMTLSYPGKSSKDTAFYT